MIPPVKVAVVGAGALGQHHARIYSELPDADLVGIVDVQEKRVQRLASMHGCPAYQNHEEILKSVEAVSLVVPTHLHAQVGVDFLDHGVHVLVEKPIAQNSEGAERLVGARDRSGAILHVGHLERFNPALLAVQPLMNEPRFFEAHRLGVFVPRSLDIDVVLDLMIHDLDLILHLVPSPIQEVRAVGIPVLTPRIDIANARLEFQNGCVANITASRVSQERIRKLRFFQVNDYISIDFHKQEVEMHTLVAAEQGMRMRERNLEIHPDEPLKLEIQAFLRAVRGSADSSDTPGGCSAEEGERALALGLEIKEAIGKRSGEVKP